MSLQEDSGAESIAENSTVFASPAGPLRGRASLRGARAWLGKNTPGQGSASAKAGMGRGGSLACKPTGRAARGEPNCVFGGLSGEGCAAYEEMFSSQRGSQHPPLPGEGPSVPRNSEGALCCGWELELVYPPPPPPTSPLQAVLILGRAEEEVGLSGRVCVLGLGRGLTAACRDWGTQAWACALCSSAAGLSPSSLPQPAHHTAQGLGPARGLPPKCPGLPPAQTCPGNSWGPSFSCPLSHLHCSSPSLSSTLLPPAQPHPLPCCCLRSHVYMGYSGGPPRACL